MMLCAHASPTAAAGGGGSVGLQSENPKSADQQTAAVDSCAGTARPPAVRRRRAANGRGPPAELAIPSFVDQMPRPKHDSFY
jgi:hypothetical protein